MASFGRAELLSAWDGPAPVWAVVRPRLSGQGGSNGQGRLTR